MKSNFSKFSLCIILCILKVFGNIPNAVKAEAPYTYKYIPNGDSINQFITDDEWHEFQFNFKSSGTALPTHIQNASNSNSIYNTYGSFSIFGASYFSFDPSITIQNMNNITCRYKISYYIKSVYFNLDNIKIVGIDEPAQLTFNNVNDNETIISSFTADVSANTTLNVGIAQYNTILVTYDTFISSGQYSPYDGINTWVNPKLIFCIRVQSLNSVDGGKDDNYLVNIGNINSGLSFQGTLTGNSQYIAKVYPPLEIPDYRFIIALQNIWSAINGQGTGNLDNTIKQQTETVTNGYDNTQINNSNTELSNSLNKLEQAEAASNQALDSLKNFNGFDDSEMDSAIPGMQFISTTTQTIINSNGLIKVMILSAFIFFVISVIIGIRRYI